MEAWIKRPDIDPTVARQVQARVKFVFDRISDTGHLAGKAIFAKLNGVEDLWEAKVNVGNRAVRIFGGFAPGDRICLTFTLDGKKRQSLPTKEYKRYERMVREHVAQVTGGKGVSRS